MFTLKFLINKNVLPSSREEESYCVRVEQGMGSGKQGKRE
jgi:hypothetical protein